MVAQVGRLIYTTHQDLVLLGQLKPYVSYLKLLTTTEINKTQEIVGQLAEVT